MNANQEIYTDIIANCDLLLGLLKRYSAENDSAEGRMIYQCRWLKEQAGKGGMAFPVEDFIHTLRHVYAERMLNHLASSPQAAEIEVEVPMYRLLNLCKGKLLYKTQYEAYAVRSIDALARLIASSTGSLSRDDQEFVDELSRLRVSLTSRQIQPPLMKYVPGYKSFIYAPEKYSPIPGARTLLKTITNLIFEGVRPASWVTPEAADRETAKL